MCLDEYLSCCFLKYIFILFFNGVGASKPINLSIDAYTYLFGDKNEASSKLQ